MENYRPASYRPQQDIKPALKFLLAFSLPLAVGIFAYFVFEILASANTSEAQLQVNVPLWLEEEHQADSVVTDQMNHRVAMVQREILEQKPLTLLSFEMVRLDMADWIKSEYEQGRDTLWWREVHDSLAHKIRNLKPELGTSKVDQTVRKWIMEKAYRPADLKKRFSISQIPNTALVRIEGHAPESQKSGHMVNALAELYIHCRQEKEEVHLSKLLQQTEEELARLAQKIKNKETFIAEKKQSIAEAVDDELWDLKRRINRLESTRERENAYILELQKQIEKKQPASTNIVPVRQVTDQTRISKYSSRNLEEQLEQAQSRLSVINRQLDVLKDKFAEKEKGMLAHHEKELAAWKAEWEVASARQKRIQKAVNVVDSLLVLMVRSKTRTPGPYTSLFLSMQVGIVTFLLWIIFLYQLGYVHLFDRSKNRIGHSHQATIH